MKKLSGSTLIETLIAMLIIMIVFVIAIRIFNNVLGGGVTQRKIKVDQQLEVFSREVIECGCIEEVSVTIDSVEYSFLTEVSDFSGLSELEIVATEQGKRVANIKTLFVLSDNEK